MKSESKNFVIENKIMYQRYVQEIRKVILCYNTMTSLPLSILTEDQSEFLLDIYRCYLSSRILELLKRDESDKKKNMMIKTFIDSPDLKNKINLFIDSNDEEFKKLKDYRDRYECHLDDNYMGTETKNKVVFPIDFVFKVCNFLYEIYEELNKLLFEKFNF